MDKCIKKIHIFCYAVPIILIASDGMSYTLEINYDMSTPNIFDFESEENTIDCILKENLLLLQNHSLVVYFVLFWVCTSLLLHNKINKVGKIKFFALVALSLIFFYFQLVYTYEDFFTISNELRYDENIAFAIQLFVATLLTTSCGILFG